MSLTIHPDPQHPAGGYAFLELPSGSLPDAPVSVAVFDSYGERWLAPHPEQGDRIDIGDAVWQADRVGFGPYEVHRHDGADWVRIGPEIVNRLDEYMPLRIEVDRQGYDVSWPDDVPPRAGAAVLGGLRPVARKMAEASADRLVGTRPADTLDPPEVEETVLVQPPIAEPTAPEPAGRRIRIGSLIWPLAVLMVAGAVAAWYLWPLPDDDQAGETEAEHCSLAALSAVAGGFTAIADAIRKCGADVSADTALRLVEEAAAQDDGDALLLFGTLYDGTRLDPRIETLVGLTFEDDPAKAAEYYARAAGAGAAGAQGHLADICQILSASTATLAKGAYDDFCS
ncbi:hypothetical protein [Sedimentitalea nanhaiensis]|uniref:Uncharacterized protein n=1 Tax=Sedimentitalea nanhaiensis TaxID=999627 RepID=A0A1I6ZWR9_9RHOB|nr:hypothetical protein [Sedimentitalea nanhaiensis]SFT67086.1 hypothetical protein SAMN05216236_10529 [Sedimentitalea nanhaiensis]